MHVLLLWIVWVVQIVARFPKHLHVVAPFVPEGKPTTFYGNVMNTLQKYMCWDVINGKVRKRISKDNENAITRINKDVLLTSKR